MLPHDVDQMDLNAPVALVTGRSRGMGQAFARGLSAAGAHVVINGSAERVEAVAMEMSTATNQVAGLRWRWQNLD